MIEGDFWVGLAVGTALWAAWTAFRRNKELSELKGELGSATLEALSRSTEQLVRMTETQLRQERARSDEELSLRKDAIAASIAEVRESIDRMQSLVRSLEKDREQKFGELSQALSIHGEQSKLLQMTTASLKEALTNSRVRGQWGERMAEDVLRVAGFIEGVNYQKQKTVGSNENRGRPDFTFLLPNGHRLYMDVKFPFEKYLKYVEAPTDGEKTQYRKEFLRDVQLRMKELTDREYRHESTLDCVILFIPNEPLLSFIFEQDGALIDDALRNGVILCSPISLFAVLAVVRQAVDQFAIERKTQEIESILRLFRRQWEEFVDRMELVGKRIDDAKREYEQLVTVRKRQLEKPLEQLPPMA